MPSETGGATQDRQPRTTLPAAERREALIDCAKLLFFENGYEQTTISDIIARAGVSKGGFYHHFAAKEDLLEAVVARLTAAIIAGSKDVLSDSSLNALERLNRFLHRSSDWKVENAGQIAGITGALLAPGNDLLFHRILGAVSQHLRPLIVEIVHEGVRAGDFDVPDADIVAEVLISLSNARRQLVGVAIQRAADGDLAAGAAMIETRMQAEARTIERLLGIDGGRLVLLPEGAAIKMLAAIAARRGEA